MSKLPFAEQYRVLRDRIEHSDNLVNHRITWLMTAQGFLFAGFAAILAAEKIPSKHFFLVIVAALGIAVALLSLMSIRGHFKHVGILLKMWKDQAEEFDVSGHKITDFPYLAYDGIAWRDSAKIAAVGLPSVAIIAWVSLLITLVEVQSQGVAIQRAPNPSTEGTVPGKPGTVPQIKR